MKPKPPLDAMALPLTKSVFPKLDLNSFVSIQPMNTPTGMVFFLDFQYGVSGMKASSRDDYYLTVGSEALERCLKYQQL